MITTDATPPEVNLEDKTAFFQPTHRFNWRTGEWVPLDKTNNWLDLYEPELISKLGPNLYAVRMYNGQEQDIYQAQTNLPFS